MKVIRYFESDRKKYWLEKITSSDWKAAAFLGYLLSSGKFFGLCGEGSEVLLLTDGDELISFCTYAMTDEIRPTELSPWMGFVYTFPEYRGHRCVGVLFGEIEVLAKRDGFSKVYISTDHKGLYEKYGCEYIEQMNNPDGDPCRIYVRTFGAGEAENNEL